MLTCASEGSTKQHHQLIWSWRAAGTVQTGGEKLVQKILANCCILMMVFEKNLSKKSWQTAMYILMMVQVRAPTEEHRTSITMHPLLDDSGHEIGQMPMGNNIGQVWSKSEPGLNHIWSNGFHCFAFVSNFAAFITCIIFVVGHRCGAHILGLFHDHSHVGNPNICDCVLVPFIAFHVSLCLYRRGLTIRHLGTK